MTTNRTQRTTLQNPHDLLFKSMCENINVTTDLLECFADPELATQWMFKPFHLIDLSVLTDEEIEQHGFAALMAFLFKHCRDAELSRKVKKMVMFFKRLDEKFHLENVLYYLAEICGNEDNVWELFNELIKELPDQETIIMTYGQQLRQEGRQEGRQESAQWIAKNLLAEGLSEKRVQKATGLTIEKIRELNESND